MDALEVMRFRRSLKRLGEPAPTREQLELMLQHAMFAPDHKELRPWRFTVLQGAARNELGELMAASLREKEPDVPAAKLEKERSKPLRAPVIIAVAVKALESKLPFVELVAATSAATQNLLLAATALGYGSIWRTGATVTDPNVKQWLGLEEPDELLAMVYLGTPETEPSPRPESRVDDVTNWRN